MRGSTAGIDNNLKGTSKAHFLLLSVLDSLLSSVIIAPAVISYWRGTWKLFDEFLLPGYEGWSSFASLMIGVVGHMFFTITQGQMARSLHPEKHRILYYVASRCYSYVYGAVCINMWRGVWKALEIYSAKNPFIISGITLGAVIALIGMRALRNISSTPFAVVLDMCQGYFEIPTLFKIDGAVERSLYILDCLFSVFVVGSLVVFVWRGSWAVIDIFLYPEDEIKSHFVSLGVGYGVVLVTFLLQPPMQKLCENITGFWRIVAVDVYILFSFVGTINLWRAIWGLLDEFFFKDDPPLSFWLTHIVSFLLLVLINCSNTVLVRGVYIDGEEVGGKCVDFPTYYLRMFFQEQRKKKLLKRSQRMRIKALSNTNDFEKGEEVIQEKSPAAAVELPHVTRF